jgi:hypothetical protein
MSNLIEGAARELRPSAPPKTRAALNAFRVHLRARRIAGGRKNFEQELEALLQGDRLLRAATERHLGKQVKAACDGVVEVLENVKKAVAKVRTIKPA